MQLQRFITICAAIITQMSLIAQKDPATTEIWKPEPKVITPAKPILMLHQMPSYFLMVYPPANGST
jgi:hypothetical protein